MIPRMIARRLKSELQESLKTFPVVALLGPRQVGKTTLAHSFQSESGKPAMYLDLERPSDLAKLAEPELYLREQSGKLVIMDEIQRLPEVFPLLRSLVDERRRAGESSGQFLLLGSASPPLLSQSSESLAGRIDYQELRPFMLDEVAGGEPLVKRDQLWLRGGFPDSFLAETQAASWRWREQFISTYLERDIPQLGPRIAATQLRRFWTMLAHHQGSLLNAATLASGLGVTAKTITSYLDLLTDLFLVRQLQPWFRNIGKRLVKAPKVYVRDSGLLHCLANIKDWEGLLSHPLCGPSWESFAMENLIAAAPSDWRTYFFRTSAGAELDLVLETSAGRTIAIEIKRTLQPRVEKGFRLACEDIQAAERFVVIPEGGPFPLDGQTTAIALFELVNRLRSPDDSTQR